MGPCGQTDTRSPGLPFNRIHPRNPCNYMDCYSFTVHLNVLAYHCTNPFSTARYATESVLRQEINRTLYIVVTTAMLEV